MRILVLNLTAGGLSGGYRKYLETLMPLLRADARVTRLDVIVPPAAADSVRDSIGPMVAWPKDAAWPSRPAIRRLVHEAKPDVVFIPTARWIACDDLPVVNMVRNMEPLVHPIGDNSVADAARNIARAWLSRRSVHRASRVIAVSEFVRDFLIARWNVPAGRIGVVPHGVAPAGVHEAGQRDTLLRGRFRELDESQFLFAAGSVRSSRGLEDSIHALALLTPRYPNLKLAIAGAADPGSERYERQMKRLALSAGVGARVIWTGHLGPAQMAWCYRQSAAFIMTSRVEACPNIALEAMSHGALCLSTQNPPMPEFFGDAAAYYPAGDASALARLVDRTLRADASDVAASREAGRRRSLRYSWSETAELTVRELLAAMG